MALCLGSTGEGCDAITVHADHPSDTATVIARSILLAARDPRLSRLLADGEEAVVRRILGDRAIRGWFGFAERRAWGRGLLMAAERFLLSGIIAHYLARKRWIESRVRCGIDQGIRQLVVVGAGYDSLAWRLQQEFPDVCFFEIDHPATQTSKRSALGERENLLFLPADFSEEEPTRILSKCDRFDPRQPAVVVAEGLTMYFEEAKVMELYRAFATVAGFGGKVITTFMEALEDGPAAFQGGHPAIRWWLRLRREPFRWGCRRDELAEFCGACGLSPGEVADHHDLRSEILRPRGVGDLPLARGECLCLLLPS